MASGPHAPIATPVLSTDIFVFRDPDAPAQPSAASEAHTGLLRDAFVVTDGIRTWSVSLISAGLQHRAFAAFDGGVPPRDTALWILSSRVDVAKAPPRGGMGFAKGIPIDTPYGLVPVEELRPGDEVITEEGPKPIREVRRRRAARAIIIPPGFFGDAGPDHPVIVGRETWIGMEGPALDELFSLGEALIRAGDLETQPGIRLSGRAELVTFGTGASNLVMAGGLPFLCGRPQNAHLRLLSCGEAQITLAGPPGRVTPRLAFRGAA